MKRITRMLAWLALTVQAATVFAANDGGSVSYPAVTPGAALSFPRDHGAHPQFRTEWWYATGHLQTSSGRALGFQVTFFRSRTGIGERSTSRFAPSQLVFAHAALADPKHGKLRHDERIARAGSRAHARTETLDVKLDRWTMKMEGQEIRAKIDAKDFALDLTMVPTQPPLLQGNAGYSRKGPQPQQASYYVSLVQIQVNGTVRVLDGSGRGAERVTGVAWFDHEWSSELLAADAAGWDWLGANFDDGGALMAFRMRSKDGGVLWSAGTRVLADGRVLKYEPHQITFTPRRSWRSPRTGTVWPVEVQISAGDERFLVVPWMDDQELDSTRSTGILYWEGAVDVLRDASAAAAASADQKPQPRIGRGYLELTGYAKPIRF
jgi:predicted secreted hydrolase